MKLRTTKFVNDVSAKQRVKPVTTSKAKQQLLAKQIFSLQTRKFRRDRIIPLKIELTWSADLIAKPSLSKYNNYHRFILTDMLTKYAWDLYSP